MNYEQIDRIMLSYGLERDKEKRHGTDYIFVKGKKHRIILERLKRIDRHKNTEGSARGFLLVKDLDEYKNTCSKNGHINVKNIQSEAELRSIVERVIKHFNNIY